MKEALFYEACDNQKVRCNLCPHNCLIPTGEKGICNVRQNKNGRLLAASYGKITSIALDPIEKKPLYHFHPGKKILSLGSFGCNFHCGFCQNHEISMGNPNYRLFTANDIAELSIELAVQDNIGVAYTYNEPFMGIEFMKDCSQHIVEQGQKNVIVTNGYVKEEPLQSILPFIHAMNIDLKSFNSSFYQKIGGKTSDVMRTIEIASKNCHVEVTTLIIAGENDTKEEMKRLAEWLSKIDKEIPLHISRFFPAHQYSNRGATPVETVYGLVEMAKQYLTYVYAGNC